MGMAIVTKCVDRKHVQVVIFTVEKLKAQTTTWNIDNYADYALGWFVLA